MMLIYASSCFAGALVDFFRLYFLFLSEVLLLSAFQVIIVMKIMIMNSVSVPTVPTPSSDWLNTSTRCHWDVDFNKAKDVLPKGRGHIQPWCVCRGQLCYHRLWSCIFSHRVALVLTAMSFCLHDETVLTTGTTCQFSHRHGQAIALTPDPWPDSGA